MDAGYRRPTQRWAVVLPVLAVSVLALCGLVLLGLGTARVGVLPILIGAAGALIPVVIVVATFLWVDRWEPEPTRLLLFAFGWGACGAALAAIAINGTAETVADHLLGIGRGDTVGALFSAPLFEEAAKGAFLVGLLIWRRQEFDGVIDGIVYAGVVAAGFAFSENIYYFALAFVSGGFGSDTGGVVAVFILRGVLSPFIHPMFTVLTGIGLGISARTRSPMSRVLAPVLGYVAAVGLHALWNGAATFGGGATFVDFYFLVMVPIFLAMVWLVVWQRRREQRTIVRQLPAMVRHGWIRQTEVEWLASMAGRRRWRTRVRREFGRADARTVRVYQAAVTELAFLRNSMAAGTMDMPGAVRYERLVGDVQSAGAMVHAISTDSRTGEADHPDRM